MEKAIENVKCLLGEQSAQSFAIWYKRVQNISNANKVFRRVASTKDIEQLIDYFAEIRYALIFIGLGFEVEFEPAGGKGPDLKIARDKCQAVVEVMRFRKIYPGPPLLSLDDGNLELPTYGNPLRDIRKASEKILAKFPQVENQRGIIAIWSDEEELEDPETMMAVHNMRADADKGLLVLPKNLLFVLYGSKWVGDKQLYCFPFRYLEEPFETWKSEIEVATVFNLIQQALD